MPNKRSKRENKPIFYCPYCQNKLWRLGSEKHFLLCQDSAELKKILNCSVKKAKIVMANYPTYVNKNSWIEEFFCEKDGLMWLLLTRETEGILRSVPAREKDWKRTTKTIDPNIPNPSVSEYSYHMSRGTLIKQWN